MKKVFRNFLFIFSIIYLIQYSSCLTTRSIKSLLMSNKNGFTKLTINNPKSDTSVLTLKIKEKDDQFSVGISNVNDFIISNKKNEIIKIKDANETIINSPYIITNSFQINGDMKYNNIKQWKLLYVDNFKNNNNNWNLDKISQCNYYYILGGNCYLSDNKLEKIYENLPEHENVKIEALFHYIGKWDQHTGYLKTEIDNNEKFLWTGRCKNIEGNFILDKEMCGYQVCKMGDIINVSFEHKENNLKLIFGSTLDNKDACAQSYGISDIKIYIK